MCKIDSFRLCRNLWIHTSRTSVVIDANKHLGALTRLGRIDVARKVFDEMPQSDEYTRNTIITGYANAGRLDEARELLDMAPKRSAVTWCSLVSGYCKAGSEIESFRLFCKMQHEGFKPSHFTLGSLLRLCSIKRLLTRGEQIHGYAIKNRFDMDVYVVTSLIEVYAKCSRIVEAEHLFGSMPVGKNHVTWTALINGYSHNGDSMGAIQCFRRMKADGVGANQYTFPGVLVACAAIYDIVLGKQVHSCVVRGGFRANIFVCSALVDMYTKCGDLDSAWGVVESMEVDDLISWNVMIVGCVRRGAPERALSVFRKMQVKGMDLEYAYTSVLNSVTLMKDVINGKKIHSLVVKSGFEGYTFVCNALIDLYAKLNDLNSAYKLFDLLVEKDLISWTSLITGCAHNGLHESSFKFFSEMRKGGVIDCDDIVTSTVISSCAELACLNLGQQAHANSVKCGIDGSLSVDNSLVSFYAHCGCLQDAAKIFESMRTRNVISWTALIVGYAQNGEGRNSILLYEEMIASGVKPDYVTFIGLLFACSHTGLTECGRYYFASMVKDHGIKPGPDHYACMIDLLGRSGRIFEAEELLNEMAVEPDSTLWKSLLSASRKHGNVKLAKRAATALIELEPSDPASYIMLSNAYSAAGKWEEAAAVRRLMKGRGVGKEPGCSWMEMKGKIETFTCDDRRHPDAEAIFARVDEVLRRIAEAGYVADMSFALHDINEEGKLHGLAYHSEKLAVAFGLLRLPDGAPIRIYKNIRVCGDCHTAMKFISSVYRRHIVLRDSNRFHHFNEGLCSCDDYW